MRGNSNVRPAGQLSAKTGRPGSQFSPSAFGTAGSQTAGQQTMGPQSAVNSNAVLQNTQSPSNFTPTQPAAQYQAVAPVYGISSFAPKQSPVQYPPVDTGIPWTTIAIGGAIGVAAIVAIAVLFPAQPAA